MSTELSFINTRRPNAGVQAWHHAAKEWDHAVTLPESYATAQTKLDALAALVADNTGVDLAGLVMLHPAKDWEKHLKSAAADHGRRQFIADGATTARRVLGQALDHARRDLYPAFIEQLGDDLAHAEDTFTSAVNDLGPVALNVSAAVERNPVAFATMMQEGRKLAALVPLMQNPTGHRITTTPVIHLAVMADVVTLPKLSHNLATGEKNYTERDWQQHGAILTVRDKARNITEHLVRSARGDFKDVTLRFARTREEYDQRCAVLRSVGEVARTGVKPQRGNTSQVML